MLSYLTFLQSLGYLTEKANSRPLIKYGPKSNMVVIQQSTQK